MSREYRVVDEADPHRSPLRQAEAFWDCLVKANQAGRDGYELVELDQGRTPTRRIALSFVLDRHDEFEDGDGI